MRGPDLDPHGKNSYRLARSKLRAGLGGSVEGSVQIGCREEGIALGGFHRAASTSHSWQWKDNKLGHLGLLWLELSWIVIFWLLCFGLVWQTSVSCL